MQSDTSKLQSCECATSNFASLQSQELVPVARAVRAHWTHLLDVQGDHHAYKLMLSSAAVAAAEKAEMMRSTAEKAGGDFDDSVAQDGVVWS